MLSIFCIVDLLHKSATNQQCIIFKSATLTSSTNWLVKRIFSSPSKYVSLDFRAETHLHRISSIESFLGKQYSVFVVYY